MSTDRSRALPAVIFVLVIALAACGADDAVDSAAAADDMATENMATEDMGMDDMATEDMAMDDAAEEGHGDVHPGDEEGDDPDGDFSWGHPADADEATRTIEIEAADDFTFGPAEMQVEVGETVTFRVTNVGQLDHDFTLGDEQTQQAHAEEMAEMDGMDHHGAEEPNAMTIHPGEAMEMTWTFTQPGEVLIGCHVPGHSEAGMRGTVTIAEGT